MSDAKKLLKQLAVLRPIVEHSSLSLIRKGQNSIGEIMLSRERSQVIFKRHDFENFEGGWILPHDECRQGVLLYLHGGGYTCGSLGYARGVSALLASNLNTKVFCAAYRLAPEHPFPAALEDTLAAYRYLLSKGYEGRITLCGESAGGGLCYALCMRLKEEGLPLPCGIVVFSPWSDLTAGGESYEKNRDSDPSITRELLAFYADQYSSDLKNPLVSPLFGELDGMPPSLIFAAQNEIMYSDAEALHEALLRADCESKFYSKPDRPHAYLLYGLPEDRKDFELINRFLDRTMAKAQKLRWMRLDNAAKIYPAARRKGWSNVFRLSFTLTEDIDKEVLRSALDVVVRRFPSFAVRLRRGLFWYYLEQIPTLPEIKNDYSYPLAFMNKGETSRCAFRVLVYKKRIALETFHSLTDGNGALIFLKTLVAEYLRQKKNITVSSVKGVLPCLQEPTADETEDSFLKNAGNLTADRREKTAWNPKGTPTTGGFLNLTCLTLSSKEIYEKAKEKGVSVSAFLTAVMLMALQNLQKSEVAQTKKRRPLKVLLPVNLRPIFGSSTLRNFALYVTPEILPALGEYSFDEILTAVKSTMAGEINPKQMSMKIATNVASEKLMAVRMMPLFVKNLVMKAVFNAVGERKSCLSLSNLGVVDLPEEMLSHVSRMDFILGSQATSPYNCGVITFKDVMRINFIRNIKEPKLEYHFFKVLEEFGIAAEVQSNRGDY